MKYTVVWLKAAQDLLATIWLNSANRQDITCDAANVIDAQLRVDPYAYSESRSTENDRILLFRPFGVAVDVVMRIVW